MQLGPKGKQRNTFVQSLKRFMMRTPQLQRNEHFLPLGGNLEWTLQLRLQSPPGQVWRRQRNEVKLQNVAADPNQTEATRLTDVFLRRAGGYFVDELRRVLTCAGWLCR